MFFESKYKKRLTMEMIKYKSLLSVANINLIKINALFVSQCASIMQPMHVFSSGFKHLVMFLLYTKNKEKEIASYFTEKAALFFGIKSESFSKKNKTMKTNKNVYKKKIEYYCYEFKSIEKKKNTLKAKKNSLVEI